MAQELPVIPDPHSLLATRSFGGISPCPQAQFQPYKSVEFLSNFQNVKLPCTNKKSPYWWLSVDGSGFAVCKFLTTKNRRRSNTDLGLSIPGVWSMCDPVVLAHLQWGIDPRTSGRMDCDVIDVNSAPDESAKESSYLHVNGRHL